MVLEDAVKYLHNGKFEAAIDLLDDNFGQYAVENQDHVEANIIRSRAYYHIARLDQAIYYVDQIINNQAEIEIKELSMIEANVLKCMYQFSIGEVSEAEALLDILADQIDKITELSDPALRIKGYFAYLQGMITENEGKTNKSISYFLESCDIFLAIQNYFELNIIYYKLGLLFRLQGKTEESRKFLVQSLEIAEQLDLETEIATAATLLGQDYLMHHDYPESRSYLDKGLTEWEAVGSLFGKVWALAELAILEFLTGDKEKAFSRYKQVYELSKEHLPAFHLSGHLLNLVKFGLETGYSEEVSDYISELKQLSINNDNQGIEDRLVIAEYLVNMKTGRISKIFGKINELEASTKSSNYFIKLESLLIHIQMLLLEYKITERKVLKGKVLEEAREKIEELLGYIHNNAGITYELYSHIIRSQLDILQSDPNEFVTLLRENVELDDPNFQKLYDQLSENITNSDEVTWQVNKFNFSKELHSIPKLKILLFLLPRTRASFSELMKGTGISSGNLTGQCDKLVELEYIIKDKEFQDERPQTFFSLTGKGYVEVKEYFSHLFEYLEKLVF